MKNLDKKNNKEYIQLFIQEIMAKKRLSSNTQKAYMQDLKVFIDFFEIYPGNNLLQDFYFFLRNQKVASATIARRMSTVIQFMCYCKENNLISFDITNKMRIKQPKQYAAFMESSDLEKIRNVLGNGKNDIRICAIIEVLYSTGMRIHELLAMKMQDMKQILDTNRLLIIGKGGHQRFVFFSNQAIEKLKIYIEEYVCAGRMFVFASKAKNKALTRQRVFQMLKDVAKRAEVDPDIVFPHSFRHRMLTDLVNGNADLVSVQKIAGHKQLNTTARYIHIEDSLYEDIAKYHPINKE